MAAERLVVIAAALIAGGCNAILGPSPLNGDWRVVDFARFSLYLRPGSFCESNTDALDRVLEDQYAVTLAALDVQLDRRISGFLYTSGADAGRNSDRSGTAYVETGAFNAVCVPPIEDVFGIVQHESNHVIEGSALGQPGTHFVSEGLASAVISERYRRFGKTFFYTWTRDSRMQIPPLADLIDDDKWPHMNQAVAYNAAASFLAYVLETYGSRRLKGIYYASSEEFADRVRAAYGKSLQDLEAEWLRFCATFSAPI
jgi:hypothetical protein